MVAVRDMKCRADIAEMAALGKFEQEFIVYGCEYIKDDGLHFRVSGQGMDLFHYQNESSLEDVYAGPVTEYVYRTLVPSGMTEEYQWKAKLVLAQRLKGYYPEEILQKLHNIVKVDNTDAALPLFRELQHKLIGHFDRNLFQLVDGLLLRAFSQKKLKAQSYQELCGWLEYLLSQMEDDVVIRKNIGRTFYGFAYCEGDGPVKYYANAVELEAYKQKQKLHLQGKTTSPMLQKTYYFTELPIMGNVRREYLKQLEVWMDDEYWQYLRSIDRLEAVPSREAFEEVAAEAAQYNSKELDQYLQYYRCLLFTE